MKLKKYFTVGEMVLTLIWAAYAVERRTFFLELVLHDQRKRAEVFTLAQKVENVQQPKCTAPHWINKPSGLWVMYCQLGVAWFWLVLF